MLSRTFNTYLYENNNRVTEVPVDNFIGVVKTGNKLYIFDKAKFTPGEQIPRSVSGRLRNTPYTPPLS